MYSYPVVLVLADIRSVENVGSMFRTADGAGVSRIFLSGYTPSPTDRFGRPRSDMRKTALGAESWMPWRSFELHRACVEALEHDGFNIVALEQTADARSYKDYVLTGPTALVVGNEVDGVPREFLDAAQRHIVIPMAGKKESLNVAVATGIALFALRDR